MLGTRPKLILAAGTLLWAGFVIYLLTHVERFAQDLSHYGDSLGVRMTDQFLYSNNTTHEKDSSIQLSNQASSSDSISIIMQTSKDDLGGLVTAVHSIIRNTHDQIHFYIVASDSTIQHLKQWMEVPELSSVKYSTAKLPEDLINYPHIAKVAFIDLFPNLEGRVIYLDPDVVIQGDVADLYKTDLLLDSLAAFSDDCHSGSGSKLSSNRGENRLAGRLNLKHSSIAVYGVNPLSCTFNTGVFLSTELSLWRKENISGKVLSLVRMNDKESIMGPQGGTDQVEAAMLAVFYGRISQLDPLWHVRHLGATHGSRYSKSFLSSAKLLHWSGHFKPWKPSRNMDSTYEQKLWDKFFLRDPTGQFHPIRRKNNPEV